MEICSNTANEFIWRPIKLQMTDVHPMWNVMFEEQSKSSDLIPLQVTGLQSFEPSDPKSTGIGI